MDNHFGKLYSRPMTVFTTPNMRPIICSLILPRVNEGLCGKDLQRTGLDNRMLAEVPDALTHNLR
jgi:hypothetical protein